MGHHFVVNDSDHWDLLCPGLGTATGIATVVQWDALKPATSGGTDGIAGEQPMWIPKFLTFSLTFRITVMEEIHMNFSQVLQLIQTLQITEPTKSGSACRWQAKFSIFLRFRTKTPELFTLTQPRRIAAAIIIFADDTADSSAAWSGSWSRSVQFNQTCYV